MTRKYLEGKFTPSVGVGLDVTEIEDAKFIFNEGYSSFKQAPWIGVVDLYSGNTLLKERYTMMTLEGDSYDDLEQVYLEQIKTSNGLNYMKITLIS